MTVIGVDYGVRKLALAALPTGRRRGPQGVFSCFWKPDRTANDILGAVEDTVITWVETQLADTDDVSVIIEYPYFAKNAKVSVRMGMMAGALFSAFHQYTDNIRFVEPAAWKKQIVGRGNANKEDTMKWLRGHYPKLTFINDDEADAYCLALYGKAHP